MATIADEVRDLIEQLRPEDQQRVLDLARSLAQPSAPKTPLLPPGTPGPVFARLRVSPELGEALARAADTCEQIDPRRA